MTTGSRNNRRESTRSNSSAGATSSSAQNNALADESSLEYVSNKRRSSSSQKNDSRESAENISQTLDSKAELSTTMDVEPDKTSGRPATGSQEDSKIDSRKAGHFTRSRNIKRKSHSKYGDSSDFSDSSSANRYSSFSIDTCAAVLASLDERSYKRALLRDANSILDNFIFPMGFPWMHPHPAALVRAVPHDIDDMHAILNVDDSDSPPIERTGIYHCSPNSSCDPIPNDLHNRVIDDNDNFCAAVRRSDDPGTLDLTTKMMRLPSTEHERRLKNPPGIRSIQKTSLLLKEEEMPTTYIFQNDEFGDFDAETVDGELSLRLYEFVQRKKRRKVQKDIGNYQRLMISVKVGSTSSRLSLLSDSTSGLCRPLLLPATLPTEVQTGKYMNAEDAASVNQELGSFACAAVSSSMNGKNAAGRVLTGRTRLIWTEKNPSETGQRVSYRSRLTREKLETGMQKRPKEVLVAIKVNDNILMTSSFERRGEAGLNPVPRRTGKKTINGVLASDEKMFDEALDVATQIVEPAPTTVAVKNHAFMETEKFVDNLLRQQAPTKSTSKLDGFDEDITYPQIDCLPSEDGLIHVVCTSPGDVYPTCVHDVLNTAATKHSKVCSVCWLEQDRDGKFPIQCNGCGLISHLKCSVTSWKFSRQEWACPVCAYNKSTLPTEETASPNVVRKGSHTNSGRKVPVPPRSGKKGSRKNMKKSPSKAYLSNFLPCAICCHSGGAMSQIPLEQNGQHVWVHDVCRIWCDLTVLKEPLVATKHGDSEIVSRMDVCALCGVTAELTEKNAADNSLGRSSGTSFEAGDRKCTGLVKCAASGCHVQFHPMCALLMTKLEEKTHENSLSAKLETSVTDEYALNRPGRAPKKGSVGDQRQDASTLKELKEYDSILCRRYTFAHVACTVVSSCNGGKQWLSELPVCFCGIHNPKRDRSFFGLYPAGAYLDCDAMRIPPNCNLDPIVDSRNKK